MAHLIGYPLTESQRKCRGEKIEKAYPVYGWSDVAKRHGVDFHCFIIWINKEIKRKTEKKLQNGKYVTRSWLQS